MIFVVPLFAFAVFSLLNFKFNKKPSSQCTETAFDTRDKDIISQLPDDILISIIARVSIRQATMMSVLSRRWRNLHRSLSNIGFDCVGRFSKKPHNPNINIDAVNKFLRLRSGFKIHNFRINCCLNNSVIEGLNQCIHSLGKLGVEKLSLLCCCHTGDSELSFSCHLLSELPSLRYLGLSFCTLQPSLRSHCSSLQMLFLTDVIIPHGAMECILSNCSSLQEMVIEYCKCPPKLCIRGPHLQLKFLLLARCTGVEEIELYASNLQVFEFAHKQVLNFIFDHVPRLQAVYLNIYGEDVVPYVARKLAKDVPNLKSLNLVTKGDIRKQCSTFMGIYMLTNLRRFDLSVYVKTDLPLVIPLLKSCPLLQELNVHWLVKSPLNTGEAQEEQQALVYQASLKKMEMSGFDGTESLMELALYVLRSATGLEEMRISRCAKIYMELGWVHCPRTPWNEERSKMIHTRLERQAVSNAAKLIIQHEANMEDPLWGRAREFCGDVSTISIK